MLVKVLCMCMYVSKKLCAHVDVYKVMHVLFSCMYVYTVCMFAISVPQSACGSKWHLYPWLARQCL